MKIYPKLVFIKQKKLFFFDGFEIWENAIRLQAMAIKDLVFKEKSFGEVLGFELLLTAVLYAILKTWADIGPRPVRRMQDPRHTTRTIP